MPHPLNQAVRTAPTFPQRPVTPTYLVVLQALPLLIVAALGIPSYAMFDQPIPWLPMALATGGLAYFLTYLAGYPWRYRLSEALFAPALWLILWASGII